MPQTRWFHLLLTPRMLLAVGLASVAIGLVCWLVGPGIQIAVLAVLLVIVAALVIGAVDRLLVSTSNTDVFVTPLSLAKDETLFEIYQDLSESLKEASANSDPVYRDIAIERIRQRAREISEVARGRIVFVGTETWRTMYERLLRSSGLHLYRSISHVKTSGYWQDEPGQQSMQVNFELMDASRLNIERIAIIPDQFWPATERFPVDPIHAWIEQQHNHGIWIRLVRESALANDRDLIVDLGIYGNRAVGVQELDEHARTVRFTVSFDFAEVMAAEQRWERLVIYSASYRKLLDQIV